MKIGEVLLEKKLVSQSQLDAALKVQASNPGKKLGEILVDTGVLTAAQLDQALAG
jgi:hypothetical protein